MATQQEGGPDSDHPPDTLSVRPEGIPASLKSLAQWVAWRWEATGKPEKPWTKVPVDPKTGRNASSTDPATWATFEEVLAYTERHGIPGIGFVFSPDDGFTGVDLDGMRDPKTGGLIEEARRVLADLDSYAEASPTGTGVHILILATLPPGRRKNGPIEMYDRGRFFTVTGHHLPGSPPELLPAQAAIEALHARVFGDLAPPMLSTSATIPSGSSSLLDHEVLEKALAAPNGAKVRGLLDGDIAGYPSHSEVDLALASEFAFWTQEPVQIDRLFRGSGLMRDKWDRRHYGDGRTYGEATIQKALERADVWTPPTSIVFGHDTSDPPDRGGAAPTGDGGAIGGAPRTVAPPWPELSEDALHGLAGDVVRSFGPLTEGDPVATLSSYMLLFGSAVGPGPHVMVSDTRHGANEFAATVGDTSKARKGTALAGPRRIVAEADLGWESRITGGLSSGEGLIYPIRDPVEGVKKGETVVLDQGISDKRLMVIEEEFSATLEVATREGNTLTEQLRRAGDGKTLGTMTRNSPIRASTPHVSILAHITQEELRRTFDSTDAANGFGNRFLWLCVRRSKLLPDGGALPNQERHELARRTREALAWARRVERLDRDDDAREAWHALYADLSAGRTGLLGALTARAEAHVLRLSLLYALLDRSRLIRAEHLVAALALWDYAEASATAIFGDATGNPLADRILAALRANGPMAQVDLSNLFGRHVQAAKLGAALEVLVRSKRIRSATEQTAGRPRTVWVATRARNPPTFLRLVRFFCRGATAHGVRRKGQAGARWTARRSIFTADTPRRKRTKRRKGRRRTSSSLGCGEEDNVALRGKRRKRTKPRGRGSRRRRGRSRGRAGRAGAGAPDGGAGGVAAGGDPRRGLGGGREAERCAPAGGPKGAATDGGGRDMPAVRSAVRGRRAVLVQRMSGTVHEGDGGTTMRIEVSCRRCGRAFEPGRRAIVLGRWRLCPACQDPQPTGGVPARDPPVQGGAAPEAA